MSELLIELFSEEIPARMQARAAQDLARLMEMGLLERGLAVNAIRGDSGPRRLTLVAEVPAASADQIEEKKGPRVGANERAIAGFLQSAGLTQIAEAETREDAKGAFYVATLRRPGRPAAAIVAEVLPGIVRAFPWPKAMRWGSGQLRWVRPLQSVLCTIDGVAVGFALDGVAVGAETRGHRVMGPSSFAPADFAAYEAGLLARKVIVARAARAARITAEAERLAAAPGLELVPDAALIEENAGLAEWPVVLMGGFDPAFLDMPAELLMTSMRAHQKCFALRAPGGGLAPRFLMVANIEAADGGAAIIAGNERVIRARLSDAKFFWDNDRARPLAEVARKLAGVTFHEKLGTQAERVARIAALARELAPEAGAKRAEAELAAYLAKADLVTESVVEFPELQGVMGRHIALAQGVPARVADAIAAHYKPVGAGDSVPEAPVSVAVALADKLDMLTGFFAIGEAPTGSKDPFALRRAALGVIRIVLENHLSLDLRNRLHALFENLASDEVERARHAVREDLHDVADALGADSDSVDITTDQLTAGAARAEFQSAPHYTQALMNFLQERLRVYLREQGARHDVIDAAFAAGDAGRPAIPSEQGHEAAPSDAGDDLYAVASRVEALAAFLVTPDGAKLVAGVKRAVNILRIEEKKDGRAAPPTPEPELFADPTEHALAAAIAAAGQDTASAMADGEPAAALEALASLAAPVDAFFEGVKVNDADPAIRANRLALLARIRDTASQIADFSRLEG